MRRERGEREVLYDLNLLENNGFHESAERISGTLEFQSEQVKKKKKK